MRRLLMFLLLAAGVLHAAPAAPPATAAEWVRDVDYVGDGNGRHKLDLLLPKNRAGKKLPLVVFIHGGSWSSGSRNDGREMLEWMARSGYAAASISYRLSEEAQWPAQIDDCKAAIRFLRAKAADYQIDPDLIGVTGFSAGGHLASLLGTSGGVKELEGTLGANLKTSSRVSCVVNFFGPEDFLTIIPQNADHQVLSYFGQKNLTLLFGAPVDKAQEAAKQASPVTWVSKDDPPFLTAHGTADPIVNFAQAQEIHAALQKAGVESHLFAMEGKGHGFISDALNAQVLLFLNLHLKGQPAKIPVDEVIKGKS
ncbi:MAG: putative lipase/esterase [Akkermansiaceae bacterium]|nr:putative lipase/esterase [Akkermansiaceae bacterium]